MAAEIFTECEKVNPLKMHKCESNKSWQFKQDGENSKTQQRAIHPFNQLSLDNVKAKFHHRPHHNKNTRGDK